MNLRINETAGPLSGLPKHWIKYLANRHGNGYVFDGAGEHSEIIPIEVFDPIKIKKYLNDENNLAVIGKIENEPIFMITKHTQYERKFRIFEVKVGTGTYDSRGQRIRASRRYKVEDSYTINEVVDIIDRLFQSKEIDFSKMVLQVITKDPVRKIKTQERSAIKQSPDDPLKQRTDSWNTSHPSNSQLNRAAKYADIKKPRLDARIEKEREKIKKQLNDVIDSTLDKLIDDAKKGSTYYVNKESLGKQLTNSLNINNIVVLAKAYSLFNYVNEHPTKISTELKRMNIK